MTQTTTSELNPVLKTAIEALIHGRNPAIESVSVTSFNKVYFDYFEPVNALINDLVRQVKAASDSVDSRERRVDMLIKAANPVQSAYSAVKEDSNVNITVNITDTVPLTLYRELESRLRNTAVSSGQAGEAKLIAFKYKLETILAEYNNKIVHVDDLRSKFDNLINSIRAHINGQA